MNSNYKFARLKVWLGFIALFICGSMVGVGIANWNYAVKNKQIENPVVEQPVEKSCQAIENVLLGKLWGDDGDCRAVKDNLENIKKLIDYGCPENRDKFVQMAKNKQAILDIACSDYIFDDPEFLQNIDTTCGKIEESLDARLPYVDAGSSAETHIERAKIYAIMAEKGCPENSGKYVASAKQELEIARAVQDDKFDEQETLEVVETYKRLKMQQDAEEIFNKAKKLTNPAIDFIMQVEKIINE